MIFTILLTFAILTGDNTWQVEKVLDRMEDRVDWMALLPASEGSATLLLICDKQDLDVYFLARHLDAKLRVRFDKNKPDYVAAEIKPVRISPRMKNLLSSGHQAVSVKNPHAFLDRLVSATSLVIEMSGWQYYWEDVDVKGLKELEYAACKP